MNGRKRLNEVTKTFRNKKPEEQVASVLDVLKAYQEEIDQLSKRSKFSEAAFYSLYKAIYDAPDPITLLEGLHSQGILARHSRNYQKKSLFYLLTYDVVLCVFFCTMFFSVVTSSSSSQLEIVRLRSELMQYETEFQQLKNQDITIRRLEEVIQGFRDGIEDKVSEAVATRTLEIEENSAAQVSDIKESHRVLEKRLASAVESMKQAQVHRLLFIYITLVYDIFC